MDARAASHRTSPSPFRRSVDASVLDSAQVDNSPLSRDDIDVIDSSGRVLYFGCRNFVEKIAAGPTCFICGADPRTATFNDEHVIPDWILTNYALHSRHIILPNAAHLLYGQYTVPCCENCNGLMSSAFESPISKAVKRGYPEVQKYVENGGLSQVYQWLALIYLKTHLKDRHLRFYLDHRKRDATLAELYDWRDLHHVHCVARAFYTNAVLGSGAIGSILVCPVRQIRGDEPFDYADSYDGSTILLRLGEVAFLAVLNDACAVLSVLNVDLRRITGPLSSIQLRELLARMAFTNLHLVKRPELRSGFDALYGHPALPNIVLAPGEYVISAECPDMVEVEAVEPKKLGTLLSFYVRHPARALLGAENGDCLIAQLADGLHSTIFGEEGQFLVNPAPHRDEEPNPAERSRLKRRGPLRPQDRIAPSLINLAG